MLRLEFQATRASSWYADAENSFINWEHTIGSPPSFFFINYMCILDKSLVCMFTANICPRLGLIYISCIIVIKHWWFWQRVVWTESRNPTKNDFDPTHRNDPVSTLLTSHFCHVDLEAKYILTSNFWPAGCSEKHTKMEFFGSSWWRFRSSWVKCKWSLNTNYFTG